VRFFATIKDMTTKFFHPSLLLLFFNPGFGINILNPQHLFAKFLSHQNPGSGKRDSDLYQMNTDPQPCLLVIICPPSDEVQCRQNQNILRLPFTAAGFRHPGVKSHL